LLEKAKQELPLFPEGVTRQAVRQRLGLVAALVGE
jgi:hypothetical protein